MVVSDSGQRNATNVSVSDVVPAGVTAFTWSRNGRSNVTGALSDTFATLLPGASMTYPVVTSIVPSATLTLANTVTVTAANDTNPANNTATDTDTLTPQYDVSVTKDDGEIGRAPCRERV